MVFKVAFYLVAICLVFTNAGLGRFASKFQSKMQVIERFEENFANRLFDLFRSKENSGALKLEKFDWSSCSGPDALARINKLVLSDPLSIPGNVTVTVDSVLSGEVKPPLKVSVQVQKKVGFLWVDVPCVDNIGSCDYEDACAMIPFPPGQACPEPFLTLGIPCNCPVPQGAYVIKDQVILIPDEHIPQFLARGQYNVRVQASTNDKEVVCFKSVFALV